MNKVSTGILAALLGLVVASSVSAAGNPPNPTAPKWTKFPYLKLGQAARGEDAIGALGGHLPVTAAWYGKTPAEFAKLMRQDNTLEIDPDGRARYVEAIQALPKKLASASGVGAAGALPEGIAAIAPLDQTFALHSRPGSKRTIYLDFNGGASMTGDNVWNFGYVISSIDIPAFDTDGNPSYFSDAEKTSIQQVWQRVTEDYAGFDVDVTTEEPAPEVLGRAAPEDDIYGTRVYITKDWTPLSRAGSCSCAGIAYVGSFNDVGDFFKNAWVFYDRLGSNERYMGEAAAHEAGHTLGLNHDGVGGATPAAYYTGQGSGNTSWAPIMGAGYTRNVTQFSKGEYPNANNTEDDLAIIQATGLDLIPSDTGTTMQDAVALATSESAGTITVSGQGTISTTNEQDVYKFDVTAGTITITGTPAERGADLDMKLELFDANGTPLATANPADTLNATLTYPGAAAGTYYLRVTGVGSGDVTTTGYSSYGSIGRYTISGTAGAPVIPTPTASLVTTMTKTSYPAGVVFDATGSTNPGGGTLTYLWTFGDGLTSKAARVTHTYKNAGDYTVTLKVTNAAGVYSTSTTVMHIAYSMHTTGMTEVVITRTPVKTNYKIQAMVQVSVRDAYNMPMAGVKVQVSWAGTVNKVVVGNTNASGVAIIKTPFVTLPQTTTGSFTAVVIGMSKTHYTYDAASNTVSVKSASF